MSNEWIPPSKRNKPTLDFAGLGIPAGRYVLPAADDFAFLADGTAEGAERIQAHFRGEATLDDMETAEVDYLRSFFGEQVADQRERRIAYFNNRVPRRYAAVAPDETATAWARAVATAPVDTRSLLVVGPTGTGKTHYAYGALRALADFGSGSAWLAYTAADLYAALRPRSGRDTEDEFERISEMAVLFIDDLGAAKLTEWTEEVTYRLINKRYEQCLPGIFTSNVPPAQLRDALGERITSRLTEMCERVVLKGDDLRKGRAA